MANCRCLVCGRQTDCGGVDTCDLCEADHSSFDLSAVAQKQQYPTAMCKTCTKHLLDCTCY